MLSFASIPTFKIFAALFLIENWKDSLKRIWHYLDDHHRIGNLDLSVTTLFEGALILVLAVFLSRTLSRLLQRRIAKKAYLDPGLRYTLGRLTQYLLITIGVLVALKAA